MIENKIDKRKGIRGYWVCEICKKPIKDLEYAEIIWFANETRILGTVFGHTACTRKYEEIDGRFDCNMNAKEYIEGLR